MEQKAWKGMEPTYIQDDEYPKKSRSLSEIKQALYLLKEEVEEEEAFVRIYTFLFLLHN